MNRGAHDFTCPEQLIEALKGAGIGNEPVLYSHVSQTQLSLIRFSGSINVNGKEWIHLPQLDAAIRVDALKAVNQWLKAQAKKPAVPAAEQAGLF